jgi:hypothetical protein
MDFDVETVARVIDGFRERNMISVTPCNASETPAIERIAAWERRQVHRERDDDSSARVQRYRQKRAPKDLPSETPASRHVTPDNAPDQTRTEQSRAEENKTYAFASQTDARCVPPSIDEPPFETTEPGALFPVEKSVEIKPTKRTSIRDLTPDQERWFAAWWQAYWLRKSKKAAREAFRKHVQNEERFQQVMAATRAQTSEMLSREESKRPYGSTWLNGERWEDEAGGAQPQQAANGSIYTKWEPPAAVQNG